jgi:hypothetical protein
VGVCGDGAEAEAVVLVVGHGEERRRVSVIPTGGEERETKRGPKRWHREESKSKSAVTGVNCREAGD